MALRVDVTAEHIAAAGPPPSNDHLVKLGELADPVERAIAAVTGQAVTCDQDEDLELATIGSGSTTLVVTLPREQAEWIDRWYRGEPVEPFSFDIELEPWLVDVARRAA